jgi:hypothetical protein
MKVTGAQSGEDHLLAVDRAGNLSAHIQFSLFAKLRIQVL